MSLSITANSKCPYLLQKSGKRITDFEKAWDAARIAAGVPEALFHDLRRTAVTRMVEAGLSENEAMQISGHRTRAVFDRYHIVSEGRLKQNAQKLEDHLKMLQAPRDGADNGADKKSLVS